MFIIFTDAETLSYKTKKELRTSSNETFTEDDLKRLPELNPPSFMPCGNVGTPLSVFLDLIKACRMPSRAIKKLRLQFPRTGSSRRYGNVPFSYEETKTIVEEERVYTASGEEITEGGDLSRVSTANQGNGMAERYLNDPESEAEAQLDDVSSCFF